MDDEDDNRSFFRPTNNNLNSNIMLAAIISLSIVVIIVTILHVYARCVIRRQAHRQAALRGLGFVPNTHTIEPRTGLDPTVIASLPISIFKQTNVTSNENGSNSFIECSVCLSMLEDGEMFRVLPNCKHTFHANCIDQWFGSNTTCPVCRTEAEPREGVVAAPAPPPPSAPPLEGTSGGGVSRSSFRLSSFRKMLGRDRSSSRVEIHSCRQEDYGLQDLERQ